MASELKVQILNDGYKNTTIKVDGFVNAVDLVTQTILDLSTLEQVDGFGTKASTMRVTRINFDIEDALTSVLISYIFDMDEIIKGHLDLEKYEPKHKNLVAINQQTNYYMKHHDPRGVEELREKMFLV